MSVALNCPEASRDRLWVMSGASFHNYTIPTLCACPVTGHPGASFPG